jgi:predicted dehydrogenase/nucleoside-diphosphate-sugar epimerase
MNVNSENIRIGIIGTGFISELHLEALKRVSGVSVIGCCDVNKGAADSFAKRWNLPASYGDLNTFLEKEKIDVAHVLVPPDYHFSVAKTVMEKGVNILLEKPMGLDSGECRELLRIAQENGVKIGVNHNFIFYPLFQRLQKDLASYRIGRPEYVIAFYGGPLGQLDSGKFGHWMFQEPGNIILEQGPHPISQIRAIVGEINTMTATATGKRELGKDQFFYDRWQAIAECEKGHAFLHLSFGNKYSPQRSLYVYGQDGAILVDFLNNRYLIQEKSIFPDYLDPTANALRYFPPVIEGMKDFTDYAFSKLKLKDRTDAFFMTMKNSLSAFYQAFQTGAPLPCSGQDGLKVIESCEKWIQGAAVAKNPEPIKLSVVQDNSQPEDILITGATGFIGGCLAEKLIAQGRRIRVLARNPRGLKPALQSPLVNIIKGDITDSEAIRKAVKGVKIVYHLAHALGQNWDDFARLNVEPAKNMANACMEEKVKYFIFASTIAAYYYGDTSGIVNSHTEIDKKPERRNFYARSKIVIENMLKPMVKQGLPLIIVRPGIVVGQGGILAHSGVGQWTRDNVCAYWGEGNNELPFVLSDDVADALLKMAEIGGLEGKAFNLAGDVRLSAREYIAYLRQYSHRNIKAFAYPMKLCFMSEMFKYLVKYAAGDRKGMLSYRDLANRAILARYDCEEEKRLLSWKPCADKEEFVAKAIGWAF